MKNYNVEKIIHIKDYYLKSELILKGFFSGIHRVPYKGVSAEFSQYREYIQGDDFQKLDWKVFLRTDKLYIKESEDETNTDVFILFDISKSMDYFEKFNYAKTLFFLFAYIAFNQGDNIGYAFFSDKIEKYIKPSRKRDKLKHIINDLYKLNVKDHSDINNVIEQIGGKIKKNTFLIIISDCLFSNKNFPNLLNTFRVIGCDVILFQINAKEEFSKSILNNMRLKDLETGEIINIKDYENRIKEINEYNNHIYTQCLENGIDYLHLITNNNFDNALIKFFNRRKK